MRTKDYDIDPDAGLYLSFTKEETIFFGVSFMGLISLFLKIMGEKQ